MNHFAALLEIDILVDYGYQISIMTENPNGVYAWFNLIFQKQKPHLFNHSACRLYIQGFRKERMTKYLTNQCVIVYIYLIKYRRKEMKYLESICWRM